MGFCSGFCMSYSPLGGDDSTLPALPRQRLSPTLLPSGTNSMPHKVDVEMAVRGILSSSCDDRQRLKDLEKELECLTAENERLKSLLAKSAPDSDDINTLHSFWHRCGWLVGLLFFQSLSSIILQRFSALIATHPVVVYFLTMLVGAGGNAGSQSCVLVIRGLATGTLVTEETADLEKELSDDSPTDASDAPPNNAHYNHHGSSFTSYVFNQVRTGFQLAVLLSVASVVRTALFGARSVESLAIGCSMFAIVLSSVMIGTVLPYILRKVGTDPAHGGAAIQVIMDITGVLLTCIVSTVILEVKSSNWISSA